MSTDRKILYHPLERVRLGCKQWILSGRSSPRHEDMCIAAQDSVAQTGRGIYALRMEAIVRRSARTRRRRPLGPREYEALRWILIGALLILAGSVFLALDAGNTIQLAFDAVSIACGAALMAWYWPVLRRWMDDVG